MLNKLNLFLLCLIFSVVLLILSSSYVKASSPLSTYSLSFATIRNWYPNAANTFQQIDAALWKDHDGDNVKQFTDLRAEWKFDPSYYRINDTQSNYHQSCPIERVGTNRSCIVFSVHVVPLKPGRTDVQLTLTDNQGGSVWNVEPANIENISSTPVPTVTPSGLSQYSLSFESDPVRKFWPTPPNHYQGIAAALWKDNDGDNVKRFTNLQTEWEFDPSYFTASNTSSQFFSKCPILMVNDRPCIYFYVNVRTNNPGRTTIQLRVKDDTGQEVWNAYPVIIDDISSRSPTPSSTTIAPTAVPISPGKEYKNLEQKVTMLEKKTQAQEVQLKQQAVQLEQTQGLLERIIVFLRSLFNFR